MNVAAIKLNEELQANRQQGQEIDHQRFELYKTALLGMVIRGDLNYAEPRTDMVRAWKLAGVALDACKQPEQKAKNTCNDQECCYHGQPKASSCLCHKENP